MITVKVLTHDDMPSYRSLRIAALTDHADAFGDTAEEFSRHSIEHLQKRLAISAAAGGMSLGAFSKEQALVGTVNLSISDSDKSRHRAILWGMYVAPGHRHQKIGHALITALLERAVANRAIFQIHLGVVTTNVGALSLYRKHGFVIYGTDPRALRVGSAFHDEYLMIKMMASAPPVQPLPQEAG